MVYLPTDAGLARPGRHTRELPATSRNGAVDLLRATAALGIVWFHLDMPGAVVGLGALHAFTVLLAFYCAATPVGVRARRLLLPWAIWCGVYGALKLADGLVGGSGLAAEFEPWMLLTGPAIHLWFLPFAFLCPLLLAPIPSRVLRWGLLPVTLAALVASNAWALPVPVAQWVTVLPAVWLGLVLRHVDTAAPALVVALVAAAAALLGLHTAAIALAIGATAVWIALSVPRLALPRVSTAAGLALGLYLAHPMVSAILDRAVPLDPMAHFVMTVAGALIVTLALKRLMPNAV